MNGVLGHFCALLAIGQDNLSRMERRMRWHCPPDTGFEDATSRLRRIPTIITLYEWAGLLCIWNTNTRTRAIPNFPGRQFYPLHQVPRPHKLSCTWNARLILVTARFEPLNPSIRIIQSSIVYNFPIYIATSDLLLSRYCQYMQSVR